VQKKGGAYKKRNYTIKKFADGGLDITREGGTVNGQKEERKLQNPNKGPHKNGGGAYGVIEETKKRLVQRGEAAYSKRNKTAGAHTVSKRKKIKGEKKGLVEDLKSSR